MTPRLRLSFKPDTDGTGELFAEAECGRFSGAGSAWFGVAQLVTFGEKLATAYPMPDEPLVLQGGFWSSEGAVAVIEQPHVGLRSIRSGPSA